MQVSMTLIDGLTEKEQDKKTRAIKKTKIEKLLNLIQKSKRYYLEICN